MSESGITEMEDERIDYVEAEFVNIRQSTVRAIEGGHMEIQQVGALSIDGERVEMTQSAAAVIQGKDIYLNQGMSVITACNNANLNYSFSPVTLARDNLNISRSAAGLIGAGSIKAENSTALIMLANKVEGEVTTLLDWRSALALGAAIGGILGLVSLFRKR